MSELKKSINDVVIIGAIISMFLGSIIFVTVLMLSPEFHHNKVIKADKVFFLIIGLYVCSVCIITHIVDYTFDKRKLSKTHIKT